MHKRLLALPVLMIPLLAAPASGHAAEIDANLAALAVGACQPALPAFDGLIRKRPKAMANEGTSVAFVTCVALQQRSSVNRVRGFQVALGNSNTFAVELSCTLVDGWQSITYSPANTRSVSIPPGSYRNLEWSAALHNAGNLYSSPAVSCQLPGGTEVSGIFYTVLTEVGN